jgi:hypothetical protein
MAPKRKSILDTITPTDLAILGLAQDQVVTFPGPPSSPEVAQIKAEVESHIPGTQVRAEYGFHRDPSGQMIRATRLSLFPTEEAVQDRFMDGFETYFRGKYGDASPL